MPENPVIPPAGGLPPKPAEAAKVQPKKETVRINLPPKPTSAPTIKLPTLAPGAPPPSMAVASAAAPSAAARPPAPPQPPTAGAPASRVAAAPAAPASKVTATAVASAPRPAPVVVARSQAVGIGPWDKALAIAAAVSAVAGVAAMIYLKWGMPDTTG